MGASQSKNVADSVAKIANSVSSNTSTTNNQINSVSTEIDLINNCNVGGSVNIKDTQNFIAKNRQIVQAFQQTNIQNNIAQQMQQEAQATVGSLGIGFADASNYVSTYASATTDVVDMVYTLGNQASFYNTTIVCDGSSIGGDFNINLSNTTNFWEDQGVTSNQATAIANDITQTISQTAKSKVAGLGSVLIGFIAIIGAIIYAIAAPVGESLSSLKICIAVFILFGIILLVTWLWLIEWSPFFSELRTCAVSGTLLKDQCTPQNCKVTDKTPKNVNVNHPPLRYLYGLFARGAPRSENAYGMLNMMIFRGVSTPLTQNVDKFNQGFNAVKYLGFAKNYKKDDIDLWNGDKTYKAYNVDPLPNPLRIPTGTAKFKDKGKETTQQCVFAIPPQYNTGDTNNPSDDKGASTPFVYEANDNLIPVKLTDYQSWVDALKNDTDNTEYYNKLLNIVAVLNDDGWQGYCDKDNSHTNDRYKKHARFILALNLGMDVNVYIEKDEEVMVNTDVKQAKDAVDKVYQFSNFRAPPFNDISYGLKGSGTLTGVIGVCDNRTNNVVRFFTEGGNYIMLISLLIAFGVIIWFSTRTKKN